MGRGRDSIEILPGIYALKEEAIFIKPLKALVVADLHLGAEGVLAEHGIAVPFFQFKPIVEKLLRAKEKTKAEVLVINGDLKHEFSETSYHEFVEVSDFLKIATEEFSEVYLVKGNHDNFIARVSKRFGIEPKETLNLKGYWFIHGHKDTELPEDAEAVIIGHEHPALNFFVSGEKIKLKVFLYCIEKPPVVVLPAFSELFTGNPLNGVPKEAFLSPVLRRIFSRDTFRAVLITEEGLVAGSFRKLEDLAEGFNF